MKPPLFFNLVKIARSQAHKTFNQLHITFFTTTTCSKEADHNYSSTRAITRKQPLCILRAGLPSTIAIRRDPLALKPNLRRKSKPSEGDWHPLLREDEGEESQLEVASVVSTLLDESIHFMTITVTWGSTFPPPPDQDRLDQHVPSHTSNEICEAFIPTDAKRLPTAKERIRFHFSSKLGTRASVNIRPRYI